MTNSRIGKVRINWSKVPNSKVLNTTLRMANRVNGVIVLMVTT